VKAQKSKIFGKVKLWVFFLAVIFLSLGIVLLAVRQKQEVRQRAAVSQTDYTQYVNLTQSKQVFMRYPLGRIGLWSRTEGEIADSVTRNIRLYPVVDQTIGKDNVDWRNSIAAHPAQTDITYGSGTPAKGSTVSLAVTPNVALYRYHFNNVSSFGAVGITLGGTAEIHGGLTWSSNLSVIDNQTIKATLVSGSKTTYYYIKFNVPGTGSGSGGQGYMKFSPATTDVIVAVALSQISMSQAQQYFMNEFADFNFAAASQRLKDAWNAKLGKIDVQNADQLTKQQVYTGLYTVYANSVNATDGSPYASYVAAYGSPLLTIGSSVGWAYIGGGYFRAAYDQGRSIYYLLTLLDPQVMTDILHTYQAQYDRDKVLLGNWDPWTPTAWTDQQWGFWGGMFTRANLMGVTGVDYAKAESAIADTFGNANNIMSKSGYLAKGYIPADGGVSNYMSRALDWATDIDGLAKLANILGDSATYNKFIGYSQAYQNNWDAANMVFRAKNSNGSWAPLGNGGFFEGTAQTYGFDEPQDVLGLADLYGDANMTSKISSVLSSFSTDYGFNDYVPQYSYMPIYSNSPSTAQNIVRTKIIPTFNSLNMWEDSGGGDMYYTHNAGELVMAVLGLYPYQAPGAEWAINSPAVTTAVIHGLKDITIQANNNSSSNIYVSSIAVNGAAYPSHFISGKTLISQNTTITLGMTNAPSRIGNMFITGTNGEVLAADTDNNTYLRYQNDPITTTSRAKIYTTKQPTTVSVNGTPLTGWIFDPATSSLAIKGIPAGTVLISFGGSVTPPPLSTLAPSAATLPSATLVPSATPSVNATPSFATPALFCLGLPDTSGKSWRSALHRRSVTLPLS
jgi:putative alpha-1,2-mannosidase